MKDWTCSLLSAIICLTSLLPNGLISKIVENYKATVSTAMNFFLGLEIPQSNENDAFKIEVVKRSVSINMAEEQKTDAYAPQNKTVLIYHTHTDEGYFKGDKDYIETSVGRTLDEGYSVVAVGAELKDSLSPYGFSVIHDKTDNVSESFNKAYQKSLETISEYSGSVDIYIDLHRDAYYGQSPNTVSLDGVSYARICFVVANGEDYTQKPNYKENYALAQALTDKLEELCPGITRNIITRNARYNQHVSTSCLLIEMGNEENDIEDVKASARMLARAMNEVF